MSQSEIDSQLSKKFWEVVSNFDPERIKERLLSPEELAASNFEDEAGRVEILSDDDLGEDDLVE